MRSIDLFKKKKITTLGHYFAVAMKFRQVSSYFFFPILNPEPFWEIIHCMAYLDYQHTSCWQQMAVLI